MKPFDEKWQTCAAHARQAPPRDEPAPLGFATRTAAMGLRQESPVLEGVWIGLAQRSLVAVLAVLALCALLELPHLQEGHPMAPGIENTVAQIVWSL